MKIKHPEVKDCLYSHCLYNQGKDCKLAEILQEAERQIMIHNMKIPPFCLCTTQHYLFHSVFCYVTFHCIFTLHTFATVSFLSCYSVGFYNSSSRVL
jgi:hypothetical protein